MNGTERTTAFERGDMTVTFIRTFAPEFPDAAPGLDIVVSYKSAKMPPTTIWLDSVADLQTLHGAIASYIEMADTQKGGGDDERG